MDYHTVFVLSIVIIIVIFVLLLFGCLAYFKEPFTDSKKIDSKKTDSKKTDSKKTDSKKTDSINYRKAFIDTYVPQDHTFSNVTEEYQKLGNGLNGTSLVNVSAINSKRFPAIIETSMNWYNTQPLQMEAVGVDWGKLPMSKCVCSSLGDGI